MVVPSKKGIYQKCLDFVEERIAHAQDALDAATESANNESKSTVGDKHETARAMAQLEQEKATKQLHEANEMKMSLSRFSAEASSSKVVLGSLVVTDKITFYIAIAVGKVEMDGVTVFVISPASPIGQKLMGVSAGEKVEFNGQKYFVKEVL